MRTILPAVLALLLAGCPKSDPCADNPASCVDGPLCPGRCTSPVPGTTSPFEWGANDLLWVGAIDTTPPVCPPGTHRAEDGYLDTPAEVVTCGTCSCDPSEGLCEAGQSLAAHTNACPGSGAGTSFDAYQGWDGTCTATTAIPGGVCAQCSPSLTTSPPATDGHWCTSVLDAAVFTGTTAKARACHFDGDYSLYGCPNGGLCYGPKADGFATCINQYDDVPCPGDWSVRYVVYFNDFLCDCSCSDPVGDSCTGTVSIYKDGACSQLVTTIPASSEAGPACAPIPADTPLGSKSAALTYNPGACTPSLKKGAPQMATFCCLP